MKKNENRFVLVIARKQVEVDSSNEYINYLPEACVVIEICEVYFFQVELSISCPLLGRSQ